MLDELAIVIVLYKKKINESEALKEYFNISSTLRLKSKLIIIDNTPHLNRNHKMDLNNVIYLAQLNNYGLSVAYNTAIEICNTYGLTWILLLDQDTEITSELFVKFNNSKKHFKHINLFVPKVISKQSNKILSPSKFISFLWKSIPLKGISSSVHFIKNYTFINSGTFLNVKQAINIGMYNEKLKLDNSDLFFFEKLKTEIDSFFVLDATIYQNYSRDSWNSFEFDLYRYEILLESVTFIQLSIIQKVSLKIIYLKRGIELSFKHKNLGFLSLYVSFYK